VETNPAGTVTDPVNGGPDPAQDVRFTVKTAKRDLTPARQLNFIKGAQSLFHRTGGPFAACARISGLPLPFVIAARGSWTPAETR
jgi:hypothetical protein